MMLNNSKRGFTIVEMLTVIAVLAVLMTIVTTAASAAIRKGRERRATAMAYALQSGIATYHAQKDEWPGKIKDWADAGRVSGCLDSKQDGTTVGSLKNADYDEVMQKLMDESTSGRPVMDFGSMMAGPKNAENGKQNGIEYKNWIQLKKGGAKRMPAGMTARNALTFGYALVNDQKVDNVECRAGRFSRFVITYNAETDFVTVSTR